MTVQQPEHNGGAMTVLAQALGEVKQQQTAMLGEQVKMRDLLTRFDERQKGWATKQEVGEVVSSLREALAPIAAQATAAHHRLDDHEKTLAQYRREANEAAEGAARRMTSMGLEMTPLLGPEGKVATLEAQVSTVITDVTNLRLSWAKLTGITAAAGGIGGVLAALFGRVLGLHG